MNVQIFNIENKLSELKTQNMKDRTMKNMLSEKLGIEEENVLTYSGYYETLQQVNILLQKSSEHQRQVACQRFEEIGTFALQFVMGANFFLEVDLKGTNRKPEAYIYIASDTPDGRVRSSPKDSKGGGIVDIVSIALRVTMLESHTPPVNGPILLDEPGKHLSEKYTASLEKLIAAISENMGRQIIMVTHIPSMLNSDANIIDVTMKDRVSHIPYRENNS